MSDIRAELEAMRAKVQATTPGQWYMKEGYICRRSNYLDGEEFDQVVTAHPRTEADAEFIVQSRADMGRLLDAVEAVQRLHLKVHKCTDGWWWNPEGVDRAKGANRGPCPTLAALSEHLGGRDE